jgi:hypothetical protein
MLPPDGWRGKKGKNGALDASLAGSAEKEIIINKK